MAKKRGNPNLIPGVSGNPAGRPKGALNKTTLEQRELIQRAFHEIGGLDGLVKWAKKNQTEFYNGLWAKILPKEVNLTGNITLGLELLSDDELLTTARHYASLAGLLGSADGDGAPGEGTTTH